MIFFNINLDFSPQRCILNKYRHKKKSYQSVIPVSGSNRYIFGFILGVDKQAGQRLLCAKNEIGTLNWLKAPKKESLVHSILTLTELVSFTDPKHTIEFLSPQ